MDDTRSTPGTDGPRPEPIRWYGTSWVERGTGYRVRRVLVPLGALLCVAAGALVLRLAVSGVAMSDAGGFVNLLLTGAIAICSALAAVRTWKVLTEGRAALTGWMTEDRSLGAVWMIGGVGALAAYFVRSLVEAPGESLRRAEHERALAQHARRRDAASAGRPGRKRRG
ncbi:hypothetical protein AB0D08_19120 [Kitasatospora sp. NPDC048540]|uniref:hypothetical protein n=1 Tax=unclassified Kitasatospora TaxID=2633591 RepID=UPI0005396029|nr:hypothetical protein [Kitasatospora sp. MBT63]